MKNSDGERELKMDFIKTSLKKEDLINYSEKCYKIEKGYLPKSVVAIDEDNKVSIAKWFFEKNKKMFLPSIKKSYELFYYESDESGCRIYVSEDINYLIKMIGIYGKKGTYVIYAPSKNVVGEYNIK